MVNRARQIGGYITHAQTGAEATGAGGDKLARGMGTASHTVPVAGGAACRTVEVWRINSHHFFGDDLDELV